MIGSSLSCSWPPPLLRHPCESLASLKLADTTITSAVVVPEGPPPARGGGAGGGRAWWRRRAARRTAADAVRLRRTSRLIAAFRWFSSRPPTP